MANLYMLLQKTLQRCRTQTQSVSIYINEYRLCPAIMDSVAGRDERQCLRDDFVTLPNTYQLQCDVQRRCTVDCSYRILRPGEYDDLLFELYYPRTG